MKKGELELAANVHYSFLPENYANQFIEISVKARPHNQLGGDFCTIFPIDDSSVVACVCDAVGHGLASALYAARINTYVVSNVAVARNPCTLIDMLNNFLCKRLSNGGMYTTFFSVHIDYKKKTFEYAGAAHPPAVLFHKALDSVEFLESETTMLGIESPLPVSCSTNRLSLDSGDRILLYTDGLVESKNSSNSPLGQQSLGQLMKEYQDLNSVEFNNAVLEYLIDENSHKINDDILLLNILIK